jgi:hypothetical protein
MVSIILVNALCIQKLSAKTELDRHLTLFDCGIAGVPEGSLFVLSKSPIRDYEYVDKIFNIAKTLGVDVLVRTDVPHADSGLFG